MFKKAAKVEKASKSVRRVEKELSKVKRDIVRLSHKKSKRGAYEELDSGIFADVAANVKLSQRQKYAVK